ncbi:MAG: hypothetical protein IKW37_01380 [Bacteroidaceae bacterium]|nr:hypothetical protein [Bacteroidaceae bacterium]
MRPIDADVLIKNLTSMQTIYDAISLEGMIKALQDAPTIEAGSDQAAMERIVEKLEIVGDIERDIFGGRSSGRTFASGFKYGIETAVDIVKAELSQEAP